ncbi:MAG: hypothetical protein OEV73_12535, partial [Desulfobulbaceae bacterium]|nr:hypothetical protein [Desulfobulbaceae bacterium]
MLGWFKKKLHKNNAPAEAAGPDTPSLSTVAPDGHSASPSSQAQVVEPETPKANMLSRLKERLSMSRSS